MRLADLHPGWLGSGGDGITDRDGRPVPAREGIGLIFDCPTGCGERIAVRFSNPRDGGGPVGGQPLWDRTGEDFETLTLAPSIQLLRVDCRWHGFVKSGEITTA